MMTFLDPTKDITFKKLFGCEEHKNILVSFLNNVLGRKEGKKIIDVSFLAPFNHPESPIYKVSVVDVRCTDQEKKNYIIEMQVNDNKNYVERCQYYTAHALAKQLKKRGKYVTISPVIFIGIINFSLFIELPKFNKTLVQLKTVIDKWVYILKNASSLDNIPAELKNPQEVQEALEILDQGTWTEREIDEYDHMLDVELVTEDIVETAKEKAEKKGHEEGMAKGMEEGRKALLHVAKKLLKNIRLRKSLILPGYHLMMLKN